MELMIQFQTASGDGSTQVRLALTLVIITTNPAKDTPHAQETAVPSSRPAVPAETDGKTQVSSAKTSVVFWSQLKPSKPEVLPSGHHYPRPALWYNPEEKSLLLPFIERHEAHSFAIAWTRLK